MEVTHFYYNPGRYRKAPNPVVESNVLQLISLLAKATKGNSLKLTNDQSQALPTKSQALPTRSQALPTRSQALPTKSQALATKSQALPTKSQTLPTKS